MTKPRCLRMSMDITMTILSVILMGGNFLFPAEIVHEILGLGFARIAHLLSSHWYYLFMSLHIGLHVEVITNKMRHPAPINCHPELVSGSSTNEMPKQVRHDKLCKIIQRIILALVCAYGLYAFIARGVWKYLILKQQFFFFDLERGYILFAMDYISIIILFATISHFIAKLLKKRFN